MSKGPIIIKRTDTIYIDNVEKNTKRPLTESEAYGYFYYFKEADKYKPLRALNLIRNDVELEVSFLKMSEDLVPKYEEAPEFTLSEFEEAVTDWEQLSSMGMQKESVVNWPCRFKGEYAVLIITGRWKGD